MKKYILLVVSTIALAFTSCSDSEEIEIKYQANITVAVDKLMEPFQERNAGDFDIDIKEGMSLRIQSFVYDANGILVQSCISSVDDYSKTVSYSAVLENGSYKVVSIADFIIGNTNNPSTAFWNITDVNNINTLKVTSGEYYGSWSYETLGIVVNEFEVSEKSSDINVSIKPVTALFQIIFDYRDVVNGDGNGVSPYASICSEVYIHSMTQYDIVSDLNSPTFNYRSSASQQTNYNIMRNNPMVTVDKNYIRSVGYRALLPQESKSFYWDITIIGSDGTATKMTSDFTPEMDIKAGKQYELYYFLDALQLSFRKVDTTTRSMGTKECVSLDSSVYSIKNKCNNFAPRTYKVIDIAKTDKLMK